MSKCYIYMSTYLLPTGSHCENRYCSWKKRCSKWNRSYSSEKRCSNREHHCSCSGGQYGFKCSGLLNVCRVVINATQRNDASMCTHLINLHVYVFVVYRFTCSFKSPVLAMEWVFFYQHTYGIPPQTKTVLPSPLSVGYRHTQIRWVGTIVTGLCVRLLSI